MPESGAVVEALAVLDARLRDSDNVKGLSQALRGLQRLGLRKEHLQIRLERLRAVNDVTTQDRVLASNCLDALDIVLGLAGEESLIWDPASHSRTFLPSVLDEKAIDGAIEAALTQSDLLPPRTLKVNIDELQREVLTQFKERLRTQAVIPQPADFFRVPKMGFASRPAALLTPQDRVVWEAMANMLVPALERRAPREVVWPRGRELVQFDRFSHLPLTWEEPYVVRTDVESFYESIDHALLANSLSTSLAVNSRFAQALEFFLDCIMSGTSGLPQGPAGSEILASCYLLPVDEALSAGGLRFARYADDYLIAAESVLDGRHKLEILERLLRPQGLRLNGAKTRILKAKTFAENVGADVSPRVVALRERLRDLAEQQLLDSDEDEDLEETLRELGAGEETLWDLLYHRTTTLDEVIASLRESLNPTLTEAYASFARQEASRLRNGRYPDDVRASQTDLEEALLYLAGARHGLGTRTVLTLLNWHPTLAPTMSAYLRNVGQRDPVEVFRPLRIWLSEQEHTDWVQAWGCAALEGEPGLADERLVGLLRNLCQVGAAGPLTQAAAARALAACGHLDEASWNQVLQASSQAMRSELYLDAHANPDAYPASDEPRPSGGLLAF